MPLQLPSRGTRYHFVVRSVGDDRLRRRIAVAQNDLLLVAVDFEDASLQALNLAVDLARRLTWEIALIHVYQLPVYTYPGLEPAAVPPLYLEVPAAAKRALEQ